MKRSELEQIIREELENTINEGLASWLAGKLGIKKAAKGAVRKAVTKPGAKAAAKARPAVVAANTKYHDGLTDQEWANYWRDLLNQAKKVSDKEYSETMDMMRIFYSEKQDFQKAVSSKAQGAVRDRMRTRTDKWKKDSDKYRSYGPDGKPFGYVDKANNKFIYTGVSPSGGGI